MKEKKKLQDKIDGSLVKAHLMSPLAQFDRYLHRHNIEHTHPRPNLIIRTKLPKKDGEC